MTGMPAADIIIRVNPWGTIRCGGHCRDDYKRIVNYAQSAQRTVTLQSAAMDSFKAAEVRLTPLWMRKRNRVRHILLTGSIRSCSQQAALYRQDPKRFANPDTTGHTRGLAIDVDQNQGRWRLGRIHKALLARDWHQVRSDEDWHYSFGIEV